MSANAHTHPAISSERRSKLHMRIRFLVLFTISYNVIEAVVSLARVRPTCQSPTGPGRW